MIKEDFEKIAGKEIDEKTFDKMKMVWMTFFSISKREVVSMYFSTNSEKRSLFDEGYDLVRELDILYDASFQMKQDGLEKGQYDLLEYCVAKENVYEAKVHAAIPEERVHEAEGEMREDSL